MLLRSIVVCVVLAGLPISHVLGHGAGASFETKKDGYLIDIGYDPEVPISGESVRFDFFLYPEAPGIEGEVFTDVWVRIADAAGGTVFAGDVYKPAFGPTGFMTVFPESGVYTISARFQNESQSVVESLFELRVSSGSSGAPSPRSLIPFIVGLLAGVAAMAVVLRVRKKQAV